ncbi:MAG: LysR family transcriptional regulator [Oscillospiraceae bacterium]|nr:LysR family transcriptional regulator [Oscillospiraceae bacterium]
MKIIQLEYFLKIVECGSITKAAKELYVSQPTLTKAINNLEAEFNIHLLERSAQGICVTPEGRKFFRYAVNVVIASRNLVNTFSESTGETCVLSLASQQLDFVYDLIDEICASHSYRSINIDLQELRRGKVAEYVADFRSDLGLMVLSGDDTLSFQRQLTKRQLQISPLDTSGVYICVGPNSPYYERSEVSIEEASSCLHVLLDIDEVSKYELLAGNSDSFEVDSSRIIFVNSINAARHFIAKWDAAMYAPKWILKQMTENTVIRAIPVKDKDRWNNVNRLVWVKRQNEALSPVEQQFVDLLNVYFQLPESAQTPELG